MMIDIQDFYPFVKPMVPSAPDASVLRQIRAAARHFCETTRMWKEQDTITVSSPTGEPVSTLADSTLVGIENARMGGVDLTPVPFLDLERLVPDWSTATVDANPARYISQPQPNTIVVAPKATGVVSAVFVLKPAVDAYTLPEFLLSQYAELIGNGAAALLMLTPRVEYSDLQLGAPLFADFKSKCRALITSGASTQVKAKLRAKGSFF